MLSIPFVLVSSVGILLKEQYVPNFAYKQVIVVPSFCSLRTKSRFINVCISFTTLIYQVYQKFIDASKATFTTLKCGDVWRPCLYMYLSFALSLNIHEGMFYWITDPKAGPALSEVLFSLILSSLPIWQKSNYDLFLLS